MQRIAQQRRLREVRELLTDVMRRRAELARFLDSQTMLAVLFAEPVATGNSGTPTTAPLMAMGDRTKIEALVAYEHARAPGGSRAGLLRSTIERWEQDRRYEGSHLLILREWRTGVRARSGSL